MVVTFGQILENRLKIFLLAVVFSSPTKEVIYPGDEHAIGIFGG